jgi:uncharacterized repeat protein (TIGR03843 family)
VSAGKAQPNGGSNALELLASGEIRPLGLLPHSSNYTFLAEIVDDGERVALAVYKPRDGETPLWDFPQGTLYRREVAAYVLAEALGWPGVPPTIVRDGPHGVGSVQLFVEADPSEHYFTLRERRLDEFRTVAAFDVVANNADRKGGHCLLDPDGDIWVVDHGVCFAAQPKLRTVIWEFAEEPLPETVCRDLRRLVEELGDGTLRGRLLELLSAREVDATLERAAGLVTSGRLPAPGPGRPYPWPPV